MNAAQAKRLFESAQSHLALTRERAREAIERRHSGEQFDAEQAKRDAALVREAVEAEAAVSRAYGVMRETEGRERAVENEKARRKANEERRKKQRTDLPAARAKLEAASAAARAERDALHLAEREAATGPGEDDLEKAIEQQATRAARVQHARQRVAAAEAIEQRTRVAVLAAENSTGLGNYLDLRDEVIDAQRAFIGWAHETRADLEARVEAIKARLIAAQGAYWGLPAELRAAQPTPEGSAAFTTVFLGGGNPSVFEVARIAANEEVFA